MELESQGEKLILTYDPIPEQREKYFQYVLGEFVPALEHLGLRMCEAWHTAYGRYPLRMAAFVADGPQELREILDSSDFQRLESRLCDLVENYEKRVVPVRNRFQF